MTATVLVTGGSGFIGTWVLRDLLSHGARPVAFDLQPATERWNRVLGPRAKDVAFEAGSLLDRERLGRVAERHRVTHIIHLAALLTPACQEDPWTGFEVNVVGSVALFEAARRLKPQGFSYASSFAVYGPEADDAAAPAVAGKPAVKNRPPTFYGAFKQSVDLIAEQYWRHFGIATVGIRPHVVYGPERDQGLTAGPSLATRAAARGEPYTIGYRGHVGYDYVEDVARAFVRSALETPRGSNVVDLPGESATSEDFARAIEAAMPEAAGKISVSGPEIPSNIPPQRHCISNLFLDWKATSLIDGVRRTVAFYRP